MRAKRRLQALVAGLLVTLGPTAALAVLEPSGDPVAPFDGDGAAQTNFAVVDTFAEVRGLGVQTAGARAGQIVLAGGYQDGFDFHVAMLRLNADGTQDMGFGAGGERKTTVGSNDLAEDVAIQADDKIVVAGFSDQSSMVLRYTPDGDLDPTFGGGDGIFTFQPVPGLQSRLQSAVLQPDGKIVAVGYAGVTPAIPDPTPGVPPYQTAEDRAVLVARLNANGTPDLTFGGGDGYATINITTPEPTPGYPDPSPPYVGGGEEADGVAIQADGRIVWVGRTTNTAGSSCNSQISADSESLIGRLNPNGTADTSFDGDGYRIVSLGTTSNCPSDAFRNVAVQPDGRLVAVGYANTTMDSSTNAKNNISVARFNSDSSFDTSFDGDGRLTTILTTGFLSDVADDVVVLPDGDLLVGASTDQGRQAPGPCCTYITENDFAALRYNSNGSLDSGFAGDGTGIYDFSENDTFDAMAVDATGRPILAGYSYVAGQYEDPVLAVARVTTSGVLDGTFNSGGNPPGTFFKKLQGGSVDLGAGIVRQNVGANQGKLVVVGSTDTGTASGTDVGLVRYTSTGALDPSFDGDGKATGSDGTRNDAPGAAAVQLDDKIVVAGTSYGTSGAPSATVMRFNPNSGLDTSFDGDGIAALSVGTNANQWDAVAVAPDGDLYVAGAVSSNPADWNILVARYNPNGSLDTGFDGDGRREISLGSGVDQAYALALQPDGKVLVGGSTFVGQTTQFALLRLNANGTSDSTFGGGDGIVTTPIGGGDFPRNEITGLVVQSDGRIVAGGNGNDGAFNSNNVIRLARYLPNGALDATFDGDGIVTTNLAADRFDRVAGVGLQRDDKVVVFGYSQQLFVTRDDLVIARYNWDDGSLDATYGDGDAGRTILAASPGSDQAAGGVLYPDGSAAIGGTIGSSDLGAARFAGDPAPVLPAAPSLAAASDSGQSSTDRITNDNTPTFSGGTCNIGETTILRVDGSTGNPLARSLCRTGSYAVTSATLADGVHTVGAFSRNGAGDTPPTATTTLTVDTVANPPAIAAPAAAAILDVPPNPTISGSVDETIAGAVVTVSEGATTVCSAVAEASGSWSCVAPLTAGPHTITAKQTDVAGNTSSASGARSFGVRVPTTTALTSSGDPSVYGETVTFTATVTASDPTVPTGDVDFVIDGAPPRRAPLDEGGVARITVPNPPGDPLDVGEHPVTATFVGSTYYRTSNDALDDDQTVEPADTTVTISTPQSTTPYGGNVTFTFTVVPTAPGSGTPTGSVAVTMDGGEVVVLGLVNGQATASRNDLAPGVHTVAATYQGERRFNPSPQATLQHRVDKGVSSTTVTSSQTPSTYGQAVTFTATVAAVAPAPGVPNGSVTFTVDGVGGPPVALVDGVASITTTSLSAGGHPVSAAYGGSSLFESSSDVLDGGQQVDKGSSTTSIDVSPTPSVFGQSVTITVTTTPVAPAPGPMGGDGSLVIDGGSPIPLTFVDGVASYTTSALTVGSHTIDASSNGTSNVAGSTATRRNHAVNRAGTTTGLTSSSNPSVSGSTVTFTATVAAVAPGAGTPSGTVDFVVDGGTPVSRPLAGGVATFDVGTLGAGNHTVTAAYGGDGGFGTSSGSLAGGQQVQKASTTTQVTSSMNPSGYGQAVDFTIDVRSVAPSTSTPTGTATLTVDDTPLATLTLSGGSVTYRTSTLPAGSHAVKATYAGDTEHAGSDGVLDRPQVVAAGSSATTVRSSASSTSYGQPVTFTATVAPVAPAPGTPTGTVRFVVDGGPAVEVELVDGSAELTTSALGAGTHQLTATYGGDASFGGSSDDLDQGHVVEPAATETALRSSRDPSRYGEPVTFTATVSAAASTPTGTVRLRIDDDPVDVRLTDGVATLTVDDLAPGEHAVRADYAGDGNHTGSGGSLAEAQTVEQARPSLSITSSANPASAGEQVTWTVSTGTAGGTGVASASAAGPTGTVTFTVDGVVAATKDLVRGRASYTAELPAGDHVIAARYSGDANHEPASVTLEGGQQVRPAGGDGGDAGGTPPVGGGGTGGGASAGTGGAGTGRPTGGLPRTGADVATLVAAASLLLVTGALLLLVRRRPLAA